MLARAGEEQSFPALEAKLRRMLATIAELFPRIISA
jgi:hypothetical protein